MADPDAPDLAAGERLFRAEPRFLLGAVALAGLPVEEMPEIAFAGRSNVGKSSLINALTGRRQLARASNTPGRTQEINFFDLGGRIRMADLPGYGFAQAPKDKVDAWNRLIRLYLRGRTTLRRVFVLIDARHGIKPVDGEIMAMLDAAAVSYQGVLTKTDKLKAPEVERVTEETANALRKRVAAHPRLIATSSENRQGIDQLRAEIAALALPE